MALASAGKKAKARRRKALKPLRDMIAFDKERGLDGVPFSSQRAEELARESGLDWRDFRGVKCSGCAGYVVADVRRILEAKE